MPCFTHKMAIVSWPQILWRHFILPIAESVGVLQLGSWLKGLFAAQELNWTEFEFQFELSTRTPVFPAHELTEHQPS